MFVLGISDVWIVGMWLANLLLTIVGGGWVVSLVNRRSARFGKMEDALEDATDKLQETAKSLVTAEITLQTQSLKTSIDNLSGEIGRINKRLDDGDESFEDLVGADHTQEVKRITTLAELREWVVREAASKQDLKDLGERFDKLQQAILSTMAVRIEQGHGHAARATAKGAC